MQLNYVVQMWSKFLRLPILLIFIIRHTLFPYIYTKNASAKHEINNIFYFWVLQTYMCMGFYWDDRKFFFCPIYMMCNASASSALNKNLLHEKNDRYYCIHVKDMYG